MGHAPSELPEEAAEQRYKRIQALSEHTSGLLDQHLEALEDGYRRLYE